MPQMPQDYFCLQAHCWVIMKLKERHVTVPGILIAHRPHSVLRTMTAKILHHLVNKYMKPMGQISLLQSSAVIRVESARS